MNLKIGGTQFKISYVKDLRDEKGIRVNGTIKTDDCTIEVDKDIPLQKKNQVLIHECLHGMIYNCDIQDDEHVTTKIGTALYGLIVDNGKFINKLIEHDKKIKKG